MVSLLSLNHELVESRDQVVFYSSCHFPQVTSCLINVCWIIEEFRPKIIKKSEVNHTRRYLLKSSKWKHFIQLQFDLSFKAMPAHLKEKKIQGSKQIKLVVQMVKNTKIHQNTYLSYMLLRLEERSVSTELTKSRWLFIWECEK